MRNPVHKFSQKLNRPQTHVDRSKEYDEFDLDIHETICHKCGTKNWLTNDECSCRVCGTELEEE